MKLLCSTRKLLCSTRKLPCLIKKVPCSTKRFLCSIKKLPCSIKKLPCSTRKLPCSTKRFSCSIKELPCSTKRFSQTWEMAVLASDKLVCAIMARLGAQTPAGLFMAMTRRPGCRRWGTPQALAGSGRGGEALTQRRRDAKTRWLFFAVADGFAGAGGFAGATTGRALW